MALTPVSSTGGGVQVLDLFQLRSSPTMKPMQLVAARGTLFFALPFLAFAQVEQSQDFRAGSLLIVFHPHELELQLGDGRWHIDISKLPVHAADCDDPAVRTGCAPIGAPEIIAWDEPRRVLFFGIPTGLSQNHPWVLFGYQLKSGLITRYALTYGAGGDGGALSPSGRYLAYIAYTRCGRCCSFSGVAIVDLLRKRETTPPAQEDSTGLVRRIDHISWVFSLRTRMRRRNFSSVRLHAEPRCRKPKVSLPIAARRPRPQLRCRGRPEHPHQRPTHDSMPGEPVLSSRAESRGLSHPWRYPPRVSSGVARGTHPAYELTALF